MHRKTTCVLLILPILLAASAFSGYAQKQTVGLFRNDSTAFDGYTLFTPLSYRFTYLIDNNGLLVRSWESAYPPGNSVYLLENGHLLRAADPGGNSGKGGDLLYRWGNPEVYRAGTPADRQLFAQHDAQWIDDGLPGAGHILGRAVATLADRQAFPAGPHTLVFDAARLPSGVYVYRLVAGDFVQTRSMVLLR